jgi:hypothetical protein
LTLSIAEPLLKTQDKAMVVKIAHKKRNKQEEFAKRAFLTLVVCVPFSLMLFTLHPSFAKIIPIDDGFAFAPPQVLVGFKSTTSEEDAIEKKPLNVVVLYPDDWRFDSLQDENPDIHTPFLTQLAKEGMRFRKNAVTSSVCWISVSRPYGYLYIISAPGL